MFCSKNKYKVMPKENHGWFSYKEAREGKVLEEWRNKKDELVTCSNRTPAKSPPNNIERYDDYEYKGQLLELVDKKIAPYAKSSQLSKAEVFPEGKYLKRTETLRRIPRVKSRLNMRVKKNLMIETNIPFKGFTNINETKIKKNEIS